MRQPCGCCAGIEIVAPEAEANRPGLTAIAYRAGTYATFLESMLARLSNLSLDVPSPDGSGALERVYPLKQLTTREPSDPAIALFDAWAMVADVLTFYQERIANEGYLLTATERRSILELARLVGYKLRPGVSASVYLAFTVTDGFQGEIPAGTRSQSIPGTGELPQFFETSDQLVARDAWNKLKPRLTRPQVITLRTDPGTDARSRDTLYFQGISTNVKPGDALLIVLGERSGQQALRFVKSVDVQADQNRTEVALQVQLPQARGTVLATVRSALQPFVLAASTTFAGSDLAGQVAAILQNLLDTLDKMSPNATGQVASDMVRGVIPSVQQRYDIAVKRNFTRLQAGIQDLLDGLQALIALLPAVTSTSAPQPGSVDTNVFNQPVGNFSEVTTIESTVPVPKITTPLAEKLAPSALGNLSAAVGKLALAPSLQPADSTRLTRSVARTFAPQADTAAKLLAAFNPAAAPNLYQAWANVDTPASQVQVYAMRVKAALYGSNAPRRITGVAKGVITGYDDWPLATAAKDNTGAVLPGTPPVALEDQGSVSLSPSSEGIQPGSWVVVDTSAVDTIKTNVIASLSPLFTKAGNVKADVSRAEYGMSGKTTRVPLLNPADLQPLNWLNLANAKADKGTDFVAIRNTVVYARPERLDLAEEPLDTDVEGDTIDLDGLYDGLESGRWIIVSGNRTDIPNVTGVAASELVMIAGLNQGARAPFCATFPAGIIPFSTVYYTTDANASGERLVVGELAAGALQAINKLPLANVPNQQYCDQVQLAPGLYVNAYVPTERERSGNFRDFQGLLVDPATHIPYLDGQIPEGGVFAWRISSAKPHSILTLANKLAYTYDTSTLTIYGNVVKATHGQTVGEVLGDGDASQPFQKFALHQSPLTYLAAPTPAGAESTLVVRVNEVEWHEEDCLVGLQPTDRKYITQTDDGDKTAVIFGNGEHGARLPSGTANVKAVYRYGIGKPGNVKARQISQLATHPLGVQAIINPLPATGGADRDSRDQARRNAPLAVMALDRLVSVKDYADFARSFAGIGKANAVRISDGRRQVIHVTIAGAGDIPIDLNSDLYRNLVQALHQFGDPYQPIQVRVRKVKLLVVSAGVQVMADYQWESVEPRIRAALLDTFSFDRRELGQSAFLSEAASLIQNLEGVAYGDVQIFDAVPADITVDKLAGLAGSLGLHSSVEAQSARIDPVVTDPAQRILPAELAILTSDIAGTLILTEISR
jgi:hypothetical protein